MKAKQWFDLHSLTGLWSGLLLFIVCWTGTFATVSYELDWLMNADLRTKSPIPKEQLLSDYQQAVATALPSAKVEIVYAPRYPGFNAEVGILTEQQQRRRVYVDPATLQLTGDTSFLNIQRFFRSLHMGFFSFAGVGNYVVLFFTLPLLISLVSALYVYRNWWKNWFKLSWSQKPRAKFASLHKITGVWSLLFGLIIVLTCVWYLTEALRYDLGDGKITLVGEGATAVHLLPEVKSSVNRISMQLAEKNLREANTGFAFQSFRPGIQLLYFDGQYDALLVRDRANKFYLNAFDGSVVHQQQAAGLSLYWRISDTADPLHFGDFGGFTSKIIWFIFGLALSFLCLSGSYMFVLRKMQSSKTDNSVTTTRLMLGLSLLTVLLIGYYGLSEVSRYLTAPYLNFSGQDVAPGAAIFIVSWIIVTLAIIYYWSFYVVKALQKSR